MAKSPSKRLKREEAEDIEIEPGAWPRFERFIRDVTKAGPQHRQAVNCVVNWAVLLQDLVKQAQGLRRLLPIDWPTLPAVEAETLPVPRLVQVRMLRPVGLLRGNK